MKQLVLESDCLEDYLLEIPSVIEFSTPLVRAEIERIEAEAATREERARRAFELARDGVRHSFDTGFAGVRIGAKEVLRDREGVCFAKSHLLASLLRGMGIPAGFCYQQV